MEKDEWIKWRLRAARIDEINREKILSLLDRLRDYHFPTWEHSLDVAARSSCLGELQGWDPKAGMYGVLHDIGKLEVPVELLGKTEGFDNQDMEIMRTHVTTGHKILKENGLYFSSWIALTHHRFQPNFYPTDEELTRIGFPIPNASPSTRLLADSWASLTSIADAYDAAKNRRNNKFGGKALTPSQLEIWLREQNPAYEGLITAACLKNLLSFGE